MIDLLIEDAERMVNELELLKEFGSQLDYSELMLLQQLLGRAKHYLHNLIQHKNQKK